MEIDLTLLNARLKINSIIDGLTPFILA